MRSLRRHHRQRPLLLPQLRSQALRSLPRLRSLAVGCLLGLLLSVSVLGIAPDVAAAAEVLQVRSPSLLQVGDSNRNYTVELACMTPLEAQRNQALAWLRQQLPRRSRVNLRPIGNHDGVLLARVQKLGVAQDVSSGLIEAGLADPLLDPAACR